MTGWLLWAAIILFLGFTESAIPAEEGLPIAKNEQLTALNQFFGSVDRDGDGQIQPSEALSYIGANFDEGYIAGDKKEAAGWVYENLEGNDADATISKAEVEKHLKRLLKASIGYCCHCCQEFDYVFCLRQCAFALHKMLRKLSTAE